MDKNNEKIMVGSFTDSTISRNVKAEEFSSILGNYVAVATGPVEEYRDRYVFLRDTIESAKKLKTKVSKALIAEFKSIPMEQKWADPFSNLVTTVGKNFTLDTVLAGSSYTATWFVGLISLTSYSAVAAADTMASHAGWLEDTNYSQSTRVAPSFSSASSGSKTTSSAATFSMNATTTIKGVFLNSVSTKSGTTGTLYSAGLFTGGDKALANGDTLQVTYTATLT